MIDARVIKFGYGTVVIGSYYTELTIQAIKPPQEDRKSIDVILSHAQSAYRNYIRLIAC